jgi:hypothetical protein
MAPEISRLNTYRFFLCGTVKDRLHVRILPRDITDLNIRIREAIHTLSKTTDGLLYRLDVIPVTNGARTKHL